MALFIGLLLVAISLAAEHEFQAETLNSGTVLSGFVFAAPEPDLSDEQLVGKVVEVLPGTKELQLAVDYPERRLLLRGIYLGDGRIQIAGEAPLHPKEHLSPGATVYLSEVRPGEVVGADSEEIRGREIATRIGFLLPDGRIQLAIGHTITALNLVRMEDRYPLKERNADFESDGYWSWAGGDNSPQFRGAIGCLSRHLYSYGDSGEDFGYRRVVYQCVELPAYLHKFIDEGRLYARFGASITQGGAILWLRSFESKPGGSVLAHRDDLPGSIRGNFRPILEEKEVAPSVDCKPTIQQYQIPHGTRWLLVAVGGNGRDETRIDDVYLELTTVPGASEVGVE